MIVVSCLASCCGTYKSAVLATVGSSGMVNADPSGMLSWKPLLASTSPVIPSAISTKKTMPSWKLGPYSIVLIKLSKKKPLQVHMDNTQR